MALLPVALATRVASVPGGAGWLHEPKFDGYRIQCHLLGKRVVLLSRNGLDWTDRFPEVAAHIADRFRGRRAVLDGEVVVADPAGGSPFHALQHALAEGATGDAVLWVFDMLSDGQRDLRGEPLMRRKARLAAFFGVRSRGGRVRLTTSLRGSGQRAFDAACRKGEEGIVSKRLESPYAPGRSRDWLKIKCGHREEFVVVGWSDPEGARQYFGSLLLAVRPRSGAALRYAGRVGSGFGQKDLASIHRRFAILKTHVAPVAIPGGTPRDVHWIEPTLVAEIAFGEWTADRLLRHPTFEGLREDKMPTDVKEEEGAPVAGIAITHGDRVLDKKSGLTKHELAMYYEAMAPLMLPHVTGRPMTVVRCPDGASGPCFFQKHWAAEKGRPIATRLVQESSGASEPYAIVTKAADLVGLVQRNAVEFHAWGARVDKPELPDRMIFDLDPGPGITFGRLKECALQVRSALEYFGLESWVKLTGGKGLHVVVPIARRLDWTRVSPVAEAIARHLVAAAPATFVAKAAKSARTRRVFIDWLRNTRGATAAVPWTVRARPGAAVAVPIDWAQLDDITRGDAFSVRETLDRFAAEPTDPWQGMLRSKQSLSAKTLAMVGA